MSESIPREFIDLLLAKIDIVDLIHPFVPLKKKSANNFFACCPFHQEKSASFSVSQNKQFYYCFGCGAHGNAIDFLMNYDRLSFPEAVTLLARQYGMEVPQIKRPIAHENNQAHHQLLTEVANYYYATLKKTPRAVNYLKQRGINGVTAKQFHIGYAPDDWQFVLNKFGNSAFLQQQLAVVGLIINKNHKRYDRFRDRIMFPIIDYRGRVVGFGGRILEQGEPKYLNSPETVVFQKSHELYGLYQALQLHRHLPRVLIVEGYMDVVGLFQHGITYAVATLGTATSKHHIQRLQRYTEEIVFCFDGDDAGRVAAWRALECVLPLMQEKLQVKFLFLPDGEDPDSLIAKEGQQQFEQRLDNAHSLSQFFFETLVKPFDMSSLEGRSNFASKCLPYIQQVNHALLRQLLLESLSQRARIKIDHLVSLIKVDDSSDTKPGDLKPPVLPLINPWPAPLRLIISLIFWFPELVPEIDWDLPDEGITGLATLQRMLLLLRENESATSGWLLEQWRDYPQEKAWLAELSSSTHQFNKNNVRQGLQDAISQLRSLALDEQINGLLAQAAQGLLSPEGKKKLMKIIGLRKNEQIKTTLMSK